MEKEIWKTIPNYENYQVSNLGNVKSLNFRRSNKERLLRQGPKSKGYKGVVFCKEGKVKSFPVHQLVAIAFLNHKPCGIYLVVNHINFIRTDNRLENLEIVTSRENTNKKHLKSSSEFTGVHWAKKIKRWIATITFGGKRTYLGCYVNELDAHNAYLLKLNDINELLII